MYPHDWYTEKIGWCLKYRYKRPFWIFTQSTNPEGVKRDPKFSAQRCWWGKAEDGDKGLEGSGEVRILLQCQLW